MSVIVQPSSIVTLTSADSVNDLTLRRLTATVSTSRVGAKADASCGQPGRHHE
jgi:hypothetical protein